MCKCCFVKGLRAHIKETDHLVRWCKYVQFYKNRPCWKTKKKKNLKRWKAEKKRKQWCNFCQTKKIFSCIVCFIAVHEKYHVAFSSLWSIQCFIFSSLAICRVYSKRKNFGSIDFFSFFLLESKAEAHIHELYRNPRKKPKVCCPGIYLFRDSREENREQTSVWVQIL